MVYVSQVQIVGPDYPHRDCGYPYSIGIEMICISIVWPPRPLECILLIGFKVTHLLENVGHCFRTRFRDSSQSEKENQTKFPLPFL